MKLKLFVAICAIALVGCSTTPKKPPSTIESFKLSDIAEQYNTSTNNLEKQSDNISDAITDIDSIASDIVTTTQERETSNRASTIKSKSAEALTETALLNRTIETLKAENKKLVGASEQVTKLEERLRELDARDDEARAEGLKYFYQYITLFFVIGFGAMITGAFLTLWVDKKLGGIILAIGLLAVGFASASQYYLKEIAQFGLFVFIGGFLVTAGVLSYVLFKGKKKVVANEEIVHFIEVLKSYLTDEQREEVFGDGGVADSYTSPATRVIVKRIRDKIRQNATSDEEQDSGEDTEQ